MVELIQGRISACSLNVWFVEISKCFKLIVGLPPIRNNHGAWLDIIHDEFFGMLLCDFGNAPKTNASQSASTSTFHCNNYKGFALRAPPARPFMFSTHIRLVNFDASLQSLTAGTYHHTAQLVQPAPCCLITPEFIYITKSLGAQSSFVSHHQPHDVEPETE